MRLHGWWLALLWALAGGMPSWATDMDDACVPQVLAVKAARSEDGARPAQGWEPVTLPDVWTQRWPEHGGSVWYRIDWEHGCAGRDAAEQPLALGLSGMSMAGEVFINDELLWRDASLLEPLSRSWNTPRSFLLPETALRGQANTVWVRVVGLAALSPGLGVLHLGSMPEVMQFHDRNQWRQRTVYLINLGLSAAVGCLFLVVWCLRRAERAYGWYAAMSLCWVAYMASLLATSPWPFSDTLAMSRANIVAFVLYVLCFCLFTFRFGQQSLVRTERLLWALACVGVAAAVLTPQAQVGKMMGGVWTGFVLVLFANCLQFQWHAWRTREPQHLLLALCWLFLLVVGIHDLFLIMAQWSAHESWSAVTGPVATVFMAVLLGGRMVANTRRIERFNHELGDAVEQARGELAEVLAREHAQALDHTKLQERMQLAHDLHDGLGGSLMRSMALVELAPQPLPNDRVLSLLKVLRDDLRQVIDQGSSAGAQVPETPVQWAAPLRHRFTRIFDDMGVTSQWNIAPQWQPRPSALQCLGLTRLVEEALSNTLKHSRARHVRVACTQPQAGTLRLCIADDGVGFDVQAVVHAGLSVGIRSMAARAERLGGTLEVVSGPAGTQLTVMLGLVRP